MKKILIFRGGWEGHDPVGTSDMAAQELRKHGMAVDIFGNRECLLGDLSKYSAIVPVWTMGELDNDCTRALCAAVASGVGLGGWHGGMGDSFRNNTDYQFMVGGQWVAHPGNIIGYRVQVIKDDPITAGIGDFAMHSEQYYMHVDPGNEVLATTVFDGEHCPWIAGTVMPVVWKRRFGNGRVFYSSLGHTSEDFRNTPEALELAVRGILWAAGAL